MKIYSLNYFLHLLSYKEISIIVLLLFFLIIGIILLISKLHWRDNRKKHYSSDALEIINNTANLKIKYGFDELLPEHLLWALLDNPERDLLQFFTQQGINNNELKRLIEEKIKNSLATNPFPNIPKTKIHESIYYIIDRAGERVIMQRLRKIRAIDIFDSLLTEMTTSNEKVYDISNASMRLLGYSTKELLTEMRQYLKTIPQ